LGEPQAARVAAACDSAFPFERQGRLLRSRSISGLYSRSLSFRPTTSLSTLRNGRYPTPRKTRYAAARSATDQSKYRLHPRLSALWNECLTTSSHTVEKSLFFARRVTLGSSEIRFIVMIVRCGPVVDRRPRWRVGKTRSGVCGDDALIGTNNSVPPVCVMHRSRVRRATQGDQKAQG
jgi:hypothetical protein